jgi:uncharacterized membrane protein
VGEAYSLSPGLYAFRWTPEAGMQNLGLIDGSSGAYAGANAVTADGILTVGDTDMGAFGWTPPGPMSLLPGAGNAAAITGDGTFVTGYNLIAQRDHAFRWTALSGPQEIGLFNPTGISDSGSVVVGAVVDHSPTGAVMWTAGSGQQWLPVPSGSGDSTATSVSADGRTAFGGMSTPNRGARACFWRDGKAAVDVADFIGGEPPAWQLQGVTAASADGRTIVGVGWLGGIDRAWLIRLQPWGCSADYNGDGSAGTDQDIEDFFRCFAGDCCQLCTPDFNDDGSVATDSDIEAFFRVLAGGSC